MRPRDRGTETEATSSERCSDRPYVLFIYLFILLLLSLVCFIFHFYTFIADLCLHQLSMLIIPTLSYCTIILSSWPGSSKTNFVALAFASVCLALGLRVLASSGIKAFIECLLKPVNTS